ncbi:glycosyltransferase [bacterium]|nr:glycosyltransferase [bacterium]
MNTTQTEPQTEGNTLPLVSVIILNYNGSHFIRRCLNTVLSDPYHPKETILVDNASSDDSLAIAREFQDQITIVENRHNFGFPKGCNQGIKLARGEIIVLLNIDTAVRESWLEELVKPLLHDPRTGLVGSKLLFLDGKHIQFAGGRMEPNCLTNHEGYGYEDLGNFNEPREVEYVTGASMAIRKEVLDKVGNLDEGFPLYFEDIALCVSAKQLGYRVRYQPTSVVLHFETYGTPKHSFRYYYRYHRGRMRFLLKHFGLRYFLFRFLPAEIAWYTRCRFTQQFPPACCAYITQFPKAPFFWVTGFFRRRFKQKPIQFLDKQEQSA